MNCIFNALIQRHISFGEESSAHVSSQNISLIAVKIVQLRSSYNVCFVVFVLAEIIICI